LDGEALGLGFGRGEDAFGILERVALLFLIIGEQRLRFLAQLRRPFEVDADLRRPVVEGGGDHLGQGLPGQDDEDNEGGGDSEFGLMQLVHHQPRSFKAAAAAWAASAGDTCSPTRRLVASAAISAATVWIPAIPLL